MSTITIISISIGVVGALCFYFIVILPRTVKRITNIKVFLEALTEDTKVRMTKDVAARVPFDDIPGNMDEALKRYYPKLPPYKEVFKYNVSDLIEKVDWVIDPKEFLQEKYK